MIGMKRNLKQILEIAETAADPKTKLQARAIANDCYKYIMDLTTNGVAVTDAIKFVQNNKEKIILKENIDKESKMPDYDDDKDQLDEEQEEQTREINHMRNQVF